MGLRARSRSLLVHRRRSYETGCVSKKVRDLAHWNEDLVLKMGFDIEIYLV